MSAESIKNPSISDNTFAPIFIDLCPLPDVKFGGNYLRLSSVSAHKNVVNLTFLRTRYMVKIFKHRFHIR